MALMLAALAVALGICAMALRPQRDSDQIKKLSNEMVQQVSCLRDVRANLAMRWMKAALGDFCVFAKIFVLVQRIPDPIDCCVAA